MSVSNLVPRISKLEVATSDDSAKLINLWLHNKAKTTQDTYRRDVAWFLAFVCDRPLNLVTLEDLQAFHQALIEQGLAYNTQRRRLMAVKSLLSFGHRVGAISVDCGKPFELKAATKNPPCSHHERGRYAAPDPRLPGPAARRAHSANALRHGRESL